ncbi:MAG TPA: hypothetical protein VF584_08135 [Longimicrobium sp.]
MRQQIRWRMLREFVGNEDLEVRRRIIPQLRLEPERYPLELRPMVGRAVEIARAHPDPVHPAPDRGAARSRCAAHAHSGHQSEVAVRHLLQLVRPQRAAVGDGLVALRLWSA